ncbi:MAG: hypothetical protein ACI4EK_00580 [Wujia sp.]
MTSRTIMLKRKEKGEYEYIRYYKYTKLLGCLILAAMIAFVLLSMLFLFGDTARVIVVVAILLTLPFAKMLVAYIMCAKFQPMKAEDAQSIQACVSETTENLLFDVVITQYEGMQFYESLLVKNGSVCALVLDAQYEQKKKTYKEALEKAILNQKYDFHIHIYHDLEQYKKKIRSIHEPNDQNRLIDRFMRDQILGFSV